MKKNLHKITRHSAFSLCNGITSIVLSRRRKKAPTKGRKLVKGAENFASFSKVKGPKKKFLCDAILKGQINLRSRVKSYKTRNKRVMTMPNMALGVFGWEMSQRKKKCHFWGGREKKYKKSFDGREKNRLFLVTSSEKFLRRKIRFNFSWKI